MDDAERRRVEIVVILGHFAHHSVWHVCDALSHIVAASRKMGKAALQRRVKQHDMHVQALAVRLEWHMLLLYAQYAHRGRSVHFLIYCTCAVSLDDPTLTRGITHVTFSVFARTLKTHTSDYVQV